MYYSMYFTFREFMRLWKSFNYLSPMQYGISLSYKHKGKKKIYKKWGD